jgi:tRNA1(Val) A37 N6-methylase TrmN6
MAAVTEGGLLGNRIIYRQLAHGHRSGFEPVLLAAGVAARAGQTVLEAGTGAGAALLCLGTRVASLRGVGVEYAMPLVELANENFKINKLDEFMAISGDAATLPFAAQSFDHVLANPPWFHADSTASPDATRDLAHRAGADLLKRWLAELTRVVKPKGSVNLILPAAGFAEAAGTLRAHKCGAVSLLPLWPRAGVPAKMVFITAIKASRARDAVLPGLVLHDEQGITPAAQAILRDGAALGGE